MARTRSEVLEAIAVVDARILDATAASSTNTEGRSWSPQALDDLRAQKTALIRELETLTLQSQGARNTLGSSASWWP